MNRMVYEAHHLGRKTVFSLLLGLLAIAGCAEREAANVIAQRLQVQQAWFRSPVPGKQMTAAYISLKNVGSEAVELVAFEADSVGRVELHNHIHENGMMKMRKVERISIAANQQLNMEPGGYHLMLFGLEEDFTRHREIQFSLVTATDEVLVVTALKRSAID